MTAQYSDVYDRQQSFESVGHVQPVHPLPSPDSSDILCENNLFFKICNLTAVCHFLAVIVNGTKK